MTEGLGSAGSVARAMATAYNRVKAYYPGCSANELLFLTLRTRCSEAQLDDASAVEMVRTSGGHLARLSLQVIHIENPAARDAMLHAPAKYVEMLDVIKEVTTQFAPGS